MLRMRTAAVGDYRVPEAVRNGAQGRNRTTDTAIFSRMLYQLSYLGTSKGARPGERAVYSQAKQACPPSFACGYAGRGLASPHRQIAGKSRLFSVFAVIRDRD